MNKQDFKALHDFLPQPGISHFMSSQNKCDLPPNPEFNSDSRLAMENGMSLCDNVMGACVATCLTSGPWYPLCAGGCIAARGICGKIVWDNICPL